MTIFIRPSLTVIDSNVKEEMKAVVNQETIEIIVPGLSKV